MKKLIGLSLCALFAGCGGGEQDVTEQQTEERGSVVSQVTAVDQSTTSTAVAPAPTATATPRLGVIPPDDVLAAKSTGKSFILGAGGRIDGDKYTQVHFGTISGRLVTDFAPKQISFALRSDGADGTYPSAQLLVWGPDDKNFRELASTDVQGSVVKTFDLADAPVGRYGFRVNYNGAKPDGKLRPVLIIESVELKP